MKGAVRLILPLFPHMARIIISRIADAPTNDPPLIYGNASRVPVRRGNILVIPQGKPASDAVRLYP